jgi:hypothetical protein
LSGYSLPKETLPLRTVGLSAPRILGFFCPFKKNPRIYLKLGHHCFPAHPFYCIVTGCEDRYGCETSRLPHFLDSRFTDGGEAVSLTFRPTFTTRKIPGTRPQGHSVARRIRSIEKSSDPHRESNPPSSYAYCDGENNN